MAVSWVLNHPDVTAPIIGARNEEQLALSIAGAEISLGSAEREQITALTIAPPLPTDHDSNEDVFNRYRK